MGWYTSSSWSLAQFRASWLQLYYDICRYTTNDVQPRSQANHIVRGGQRNSWTAGSQILWTEWKNVRGFFLMVWDVRTSKNWYFSCFLRQIFPTGTVLFQLFSTSHLIRGGFPSHYASDNIFSCLLVPCLMQHFSCNFNSNEPEVIAPPEDPTREGLFYLRNILSLSDTSY